MIRPLAVRLARPADLDALMTLVREAVHWLAARGLDQWQRVKEDAHRNRVHTDVVAGSVWVVTDGGVVVATITVDEWADTDFWRDSDHVHDALYAHRMAVAGSHRGRRLGSAMLDWAAELAEQQQRSWLRFDAWSTNSGLHRYYKALHCEMVRNVSVERRGSGALFERPAIVRSGGPPLVLTGSSAQLTEAEYMVSYPPGRVAVGSSHPPTGRDRWTTGTPVQ